MTTIGNRYEVVDLVGAGAMGNVYRATDTQTGNPVAVKALKADLVQRDPEMLVRFQREGEALRDLDHPNIATLLDMVEEGDEHYLVMEYVSGGDLAGLLSDAPGGLPLDRALSIALELADALTRAHHLGIIHRDLKPANILLASDGTPRLTDFGLAHFAQQDSMTQEGAVMGTYAYLSPEACLGQALDGRADIWAFGVVLFEMLAGQRPFQGDTPGAVITQILHSLLPDIQEVRAEVDDQVSDLLYRMLMKSRGARIPSVRLVGAEIEALLHGTSLPDRSAPPLESEVLPAADDITSTNDSRHNLPAQSTSFVGRESELDTLTDLIGDEETRLVTILGPGGMGKSRLAIEVAFRRREDFADGVFFVNLAKLSDPENIPTAIAGATGFVFSTDDSPRNQIVRYLRGRKMLLLFDNFEHILAGRDLLTDILDPAPDVKLLVTSREKLNLRAETVFMLNPMDFPTWESPADALQYAAVQLFIESAKRVRYDFDLQSGDLDYLIRICRLVGGMPLGIILAAAWVDTLSVEEIAAEIESGIDILETDTHDMPDRQRSMRAAIDYSWRLLMDAERDAFARMSVFRGGCTRQAAQAVCDVSIRMLTALVNKSLLRRDQQSGRFEIHELLRQYGEEVLQESGQYETLRRRHADYFTDRVEELEIHLFGGREQLVWLERFWTDYDNLRAVMEWAFSGGDRTYGYRLVGALTYFWFRQDLPQDMGDWTRRALADGPETIPENLRGGVFLSHAYYLAAIHANDEGIAYARQCIDLCSKHDQPIRAAYAQVHMNNLMVLNPDREQEALAGALEGRDTFEALNHPAGVAQALNVVGNIWSHIGDYEKATQAYHETLAVGEAIGDPLRTVMQHGNLTSTYAFLGQVDQAVYHARQFVIGSQRLDSKLFVLQALTIAAQLTSLQGQNALAAQAFGMLDKAIEATGIMLQAQTIPQVDAVRRTVKDALGEDAYQENYAAGYAPSTNNVLDYVLKLLDERGSDDLDD